MMRSFNTFIGRLRFLFVLAVLALAVLAIGSLVRGVVQLADLAMTRGFTMDPGAGAAIVPYFVRAAFLYFLAVALGSLFLGDVAAPQWMTVKNLLQFRTKVLTFVSVILPLGFMGSLMGGGITGIDVFYSGAGVFLVLMGIFFLTRFGSPSGDEGMAREDNRVPDTRPPGDKRMENRPQDNRRRDNRPQGGRQAKDVMDQDEWLRKQKESLKFQKESLEKAVEKDLSGESAETPGSHVTVKPGPRRPRGRRR